MKQPLDHLQPPANRVAKRVNASYPAGQPMTCDPNASGFAVTNAYIVDEEGNQVTEMVVANGQASWAHTNVFAGGKVLATYDTVGLHFHVTDWLGTKRVQTNSSGQAEEACLNSPFGDNENCAFTANATTADDATEHHFTNQMRDPESGGAYPQNGLDYFPARYYNSSAGRFMSADYSEGPDTIPFADLSDPQTFNLYAYVSNSPFSAVDPDGHDTKNQGALVAATCWIDCPGSLASKVLGAIGRGLRALADGPAGATPPPDTPSLGDVMAVHVPLGGGATSSHQSHQNQKAQQTAAQAFNSIWNAYPSHEAYGSGHSGTSGESIQQLTGINVVDTCALRLSYALNKVGFTISKSDGRSAMRGSDGKYYLVAQADVGKFIAQHFGSPQNIGRSGVAGFDQSVAGSSGFVRFSIHFAAGTATGHIALLRDGGYHEQEDDYTYPDPGRYVVTGIQFWRVP